MSEKELRKTIKALSHLPKVFIIEKLHNLAVEYQDYRNGKFKKSRGAPKLSPAYKRDFCMEMKRISKKLNTNNLRLCAKTMMNSGYLFELDRGEKTNANKKYNPDDVVKRYNSFIKEYMDGKVFYYKEDKKNARAVPVSPFSKEFQNKFIIAK